MKYRKIGNNEKVSALGLGCMSMSHAYGVPDDKESLATLQLALDLGINFWDTADIYGNGKNEELISKVLAFNRDKVFIATKFGFTQTQEKKMVFDGSPAYMTEAVEKSLKRLKIETIDLYYAHRIDPKISIEEMIVGMAALVKAGKIRYIGLSEASVSSIRRAHAVHPISALQSEYSLLTRNVEQDILPLCKELAITFVPFSPLARGLLTNSLNIETLAENDFRKKLPRYQKEFQNNNEKLTEGFANLALEVGCTPAQLALAWVLQQGDNIIPIPGTKKRKNLLDNNAAIQIQLTREQLQQIEILLASYPHTGDRYDEESWKMVDR
ncbi:MAG: aldo/keto reductase [Flavisolibacter sp.]